MISFYYSPSESRTLTGDSGCHDRLVGFQCPGSGYQLCDIRESDFLRTVSKNLCAEFNGVSGDFMSSCFVIEYVFDKGGGGSDRHDRLVGF